MTNKKSMPIKTTAGAIDRDYVMQQAGKMQMAYIFNKLSEVQIAQILADLHGDQKYKTAGFGTFEELCDAFGISRQTGYRLMGNLETAGPELMELMTKSGMSIRNQYALLTAGEIEEARFEVIDSVEGRVRIDGEEMLVKDKPAVVSTAIQDILGRLKLQQNAVKGLQKTADDQAEKLDKIEKKLRDKEQKLDAVTRESHRKLTGEQIVTPTGYLLVELHMLVNRFVEAEVVEEDHKYVTHYLDYIDNERERLLEKYRHFLPNDGI